MQRIFTFRIFWPLVIIVIFILSLGNRIVKPLRISLFSDNDISVCINSVVCADTVFELNRYSRNELKKEFLTNGDLISREFIELVDVEGERELRKIFSMMTPEAAVCNRGYEKDWIFMESDREIMFKTEIVGLNLIKEKVIIRFTEDNRFVEMILPYKEKIQAYLNNGEVLEAIKYVEIVLVERNEKLLVRKFFAEQREEAIVIGKWK